MTRRQNLQGLHEPPRLKSHLSHAKREQRLVVGVDGKHLPIQRAKDDGTSQSKSSLLWARGARRL